MATIIRKPTPDDLPAICKHLKAFSDYYSCRRHSLYLDDEYTSQFVMQLTQNHFFRVSEFSGVITGLVAGVIADHYFNPTLKTMNEIFWWVPSCYSHTWAGYLLAKEFIDYGKANCDLVYFTYEEKTGVSDKILLKNGFEKKENVYVLEV